MFYNSIKFIASVIFKLIYKIEVTGLENIPTDGKLIVCGNHINNLDPIIVSIIFPRTINWMGKKELFKNKLFGSFLSKLNVFPVNREGTDIKSVKTSLRILKEDEVLGIFPEGTKVKGYDLKNAKPGVALMAIKSQTNILPIHIESNYKLFNKIQIKIGSLIDVSEYKGQKLNNDDYTLVSQKILKSIYGLKV